MSEETWESLQRTNLDEVLRRATLVELCREDIDHGANSVGQRWVWNDGGGQSTVWHFFSDGRVLLLTFDHESPLNLFGTGAYAEQLALYAGVPEDMLSVVLNQPENYESLNLVDDAIGATVHYAGGIFWCDGTQWHIAQGLVDYCQTHDLDLWEDSGFSYCIEPYRFGESFTVEDVLEQRREDDHYWEQDSPADVEQAIEKDRQALTELFAHHSRD